MKYNVEKNIKKNVSYAKLNTRFKVNQKKHRINFPDPKTFETPNNATLSNLSNYTSIHTYMRQKISLQPQFSNPNKRNGSLILLRYRVLLIITDY